MFFRFQVCFTLLVLLQCCRASSPTTTQCTRPGITKMAHPNSASKYIVCNYNPAKGTRALMEMDCPPGMVWRNSLGLCANKDDPAGQAYSAQVDGHQVTCTKPQELLPHPTEAGSYLVCNTVSSLIGHFIWFVTTLHCPKGMVWKDSVKNCIVLNDQQDGKFCKDVWMFGQMIHCLCSNHTHSHCKQVHHRGGRPSSEL